MKLLIEKLPPIVEPCSIDLSKKLLVFVGKNNAGKTYVSKLIWGIYDLLGGNDLYNAVLNEELEKDEDSEVSEKEKVYDFIRKLRKEIIDRIIREKKSEKLKELEIKHDEFMELINTAVNISIKDLSVTEHLSIAGPRQYRVILTKEDLLKSKIALSFLLDLDSNPENIRIRDFNNDIELFPESLEKHKIPTQNLLKIIIHKHLNNSTLVIKFEPSISLDKLETALSAILFTLTFLSITPETFSFIQPSLYLPESRLVFPKFYKYLLNSQRKKMREIMRWRFVEEKILPFEGSIVEEVLMEKLIMELENEVKDKTYLNKLQQILEGEIEVHQPEGIGLSQFTYQQQGLKLPMEQSSSMINQLALLYLYFKYWWEKYPFLIIDEPEMNLHPWKQVELTKFLLQYASKNKVLMTTHSPTIAKTIINYIELLELKEKRPESYQRLLEEWGLEDLDLKSEDIGIYYFNGRTVVPYKEKGESNIHFGTFTEVEKWLEELYWTIDGEKEEEEE